MHLLLATLTALATNAAKDVDADLDRRSLRLDTGYFGELGTHLGAALAASWQPSGAEVSGPVLGARVAGYRHAGNHFGARAELHAGYRLQLPWSVALELVAGAGYLHTVVDGPLYDAATLQPVTDLGRPSFSPSAALGIWWGPGFLRGGVFGQYPFNGRMLLHPAVELGLSFSFDLGGGR